MNTPSAPDEPERLVDTVMAGPGGAMTDDVGIVTGDLTVATTLQSDGRAVITVQYTGAEEWYHLTGSPAPYRPQDSPPSTTKSLSASGQAAEPRQQAEYRPARARRTMSPVRARSAARKFGFRSTTRLRMASRRVV